MVDWKSPETLTDNAMAFGRFLHVLLGIYAWEWATSLDFDLMFLLGRKQFRWPLIFYFYGRYAMLLGLIGFVVALDVRDPIDCQALFQFLSVVGNSALGVATINLALRTIAVWSRDKYIIGGLSILIAGQFAIIIRSMFNVTAMFVPGNGCVTLSTQSDIFAAMYITTMGIDFIILLLTSYKIIMGNRGAHSGVVRLLFKDGLAYFGVAFLGNLIAVIFSLLSLNPVMSLIADIPATTFATIAACRVVRRLNTYVSTGPELFSSDKMPSAPPGAGTRVRVEMATFSQADGERDAYGSQSAVDLESQTQRARAFGSEETYKPGFSL
ncbi:hypothetical protein V5O48_007564 [Marasmius crinis-equi]|uniref:Transmembrane protein n=1 Tax=Marasmius crinis-equi TaxID=585013 RepID=A0ABR3FGB9_9AGAR